MATRDNIPPDLGRIIAALERRISVLESMAIPANLYDSGVEGTSLTGITSTTYTTTGAVCEVQSIIAPPSGILVALVMAWPSVTSTANEIYVSYEVRNDNVSGSVVQAAADTNGVVSSNVDRAGMSTHSVVSGLTPGNTYYARVLHRVATATGTGSIRNRRLTFMTV